MISVFAHVGGIPLEETAAALLPFGIALMVGLRAIGQRALKTLPLSAHRRSGIGRNNSDGLPVPSQMFVRPDISVLEQAGPWDPHTLAYAKAVGEMQNRPADDPTSWSYQAAIHAPAGGEGSRIPTYDDASEVGSVRLGKVTLQAE